MLFKVASLALSAISSANAAAATATAASTKQTNETPFQLRNNHRRAVTKEMQQQQQHSSFSSSSSTSNTINTKDSNGGDDDTNTKFKDPSKSVDEGVLSAKVPYNYKDHPLLLASPSRRLNTPVCTVDGVETDFIDCENGYLAGDSGTSCADACAASSGTCCEGTNRITGLPNACVGFTGKICPDGSCVGDKACQSANIGHVVNGCKASSNYYTTNNLLDSGDFACDRTAYGLDTSGYIESVVNSCHGLGSCTSIAYSYDAGTVGNIIDSCLGTFSCAGMVSSYSYDGNGGTVGNIEKSCLGVNSCRQLAQAVGNSGNAGNIGDMTCSCQGDVSCVLLYSVRGRDNALSIDDGLSFCCNGADVCSETGGIITLPATCAAGDYTDSAASSCSVPPSGSPSKVPTTTPSQSPSKSPSKEPSLSPSTNPSKAPTGSPSKVPTTTPSQSPSKAPSTSPSLSPSTNPSKAPTGSPSKVPTSSPSKVPTSSPSTDPLSSSASGPAYDNEIKAGASVESTDPDGCTSKEDLISEFEPQLCDGLSSDTTTCVVTVENYKCIAPTTTGRKLFRAGRELSNDVYITLAEFIVTVNAICASPCTEAKAQESLDDVKAALEDNIAGINSGNGIIISLDGITAPLIQDVVRFYPKSWLPAQSDEYCSNDGEYPSWMKPRFKSTLEACCKAYYSWNDTYEACITNGGGSPADVGDNKFFVDYEKEYCVQNCLEGSNDVACTNPGGLETSQPTFTSAEDCCEKTLWWIESGKCAFKSRTPNEVYVYQGSGKYFPNKDWKDCVQDSTENPMPHWSAHNSHDTLDKCCKAHFSTLEEEGNDGNCPQAKFYGD